MPTVSEEIGKSTFFEDFPKNIWCGHIFAIPLHSLPLKNGNTFFETLKIDRIASSTS